MEKERLWKIIDMILLVLIVIFSLCSLGWGVYLQRDARKLITISEQCNMCKERFNNSEIFIPRGFASGGSYYCVWTKNKTVEEIEEVDVHERCHILVNKGYEHYCELK